MRSSLLNVGPQTEFWGHCFGQPWARTVWWVDSEVTASSPVPLSTAISRPSLLKVAPYTTMGGRVSTTLRAATSNTLTLTGEVGLTPFHRATNRPSGLTSEHSSCWSEG